MTLTRRTFLKATGLAATGAAVGATGPWDGAPVLVHAAGGTLRIGIPSDIQQIDPHLVSSAIDYTSMEAMFESLTTFDRNMNPVPSLAERWDQPDPRTYIFTFRRGVKYHSGRELKAADVKWSFERIIAFGGKSKWALIPGGRRERRAAGRLPGADQPEELERAVPLEHPLRGHRAAGGGEEPRDPSVGTGPFRFVERVPNVHVKVARFGDYWRKDVRSVDEIVLSPCPRRRPRWRISRLACSTSTTTSRRSSRPSWTRPRMSVVYEPQPFATNYMLMLIRHAPPLDNVKVRQALALVTNRELIHRAAMFGVGETGCSPFPKARLGAQRGRRLPTLRPRPGQAAPQGGGIPGRHRADAQGQPSVPGIRPHGGDLRGPGPGGRHPVQDPGDRVGDLREGPVRREQLPARPELGGPRVRSGRPHLGRVRHQGERQPGLYSNPRMDELLRMGRAEPNQEAQGHLQGDRAIVVTEVPAIASRRGRFCGGRPARSRTSRSTPLAGPTSWISSWAERP